MIKFPKTPRIASISEQDFSAWQHLNAVVQEKVDGANTGISFSEDGNLLLQSRGHYLNGSLREKQFDKLKNWANQNQDNLFDILEDKYILFGEWLYAKHRIFYDNLPHYFLAFDIYDKTECKFISTPRRKAMLENTIVHSVPILHQSRFDKVNNISQYIGETSFKTKDWKEKFLKIASEKDLELTDNSMLMEGVYVRIEDANWVVGRIKNPRKDFTKGIDDGGVHWADKPIIPNQLKR
jgi:ATP-dependent RNA circularization protein (DNA/RNA ligase family)